MDLKARLIAVRRELVASSLSIKKNELYQGNKKIKRNKGHSRRCKGCEAIRKFFFGT